MQGEWWQEGRGRIMRRGSGEIVGVCGGEEMEARGRGKFEDGCGGKEMECR